MPSRRVSTKARAVQISDLQAAGDAHCNIGKSRSAEPKAVPLALALQKLTHAVRTQKSAKYGLGHLPARCVGVTSGSVSREPS